ncbi:hypothetical protein HY404_02490 [Candidatus Microgenomates bacterium]|nr:hypothetical protein [Candidatus Microgenomates bacterium]
MAERLAFDTSLYQKASSFQLVDDLASLAIEVNDVPPDQRINPYQLKVNQDQLVNENDRDLVEGCAWETELDRETALAALMFKNYFLGQKEDSLAIWFSPPKPYPEGRLVVGISTTNPEGALSGKIINCWGIPIDSWIEEKYIDIARKITDLSPMPYPPITNIKDIRSMTFHLPRPDDEFTFLENLIPLPQIWQAIKTAAPEKIKEVAKQDARSITQAVISLISEAQTNYDYLLAGALAERQMMEMGWRMDTKKFGCGISNLELMQGYEFNYYQMNADGSLKTATHEEGWHFGVCRVCNKSREVGPCKICQPCADTL